MSNSLSSSEFSRAFNELKTLLNKNQIYTDEDSLQHFGKDWTTYFNIKASMIVFPENVAEVVALVKWARKFKIGLVPSGGRTGLSGGAVATSGEVVVSFDKMNRILNLNKIDGSLDVEAGVITEKIQQFSSENGFHYPVDFAARGSSHIGGNIATNAGGIKVLRYGLTRDWVLGLKVVTGTGEILDLNNSLIKNATGFDFRHLFIGSEGILGFIVQATLKLAFPPPELKVFLLALPDLDSVMNVFSLFKKETVLTAFEIFSDLALNKVLSTTDLPQPMDQLYPFYVVAEMEMPSEESQERALNVFSDSLDNGWIADGIMSQSEAQSKTLWRYREQISESLSKYSPYKNDLSVSVSQIPSLMNELDMILKTNYPTWEVIWFGHIGDGNLHINILRPAELTKEEFVKECQKVDLLIFDSIKKHRGSISAEHGVGLTKKPFLNFTRSPEEIRLMKEIKKLFDPDGIINPGKVVDL